MINPPVKRQRIPIAEQDARREQLGAIRLKRKLTDAELREEARLESLLYHRLKCEDYRDLRAARAQA